MFRMTLAGVFIAAGLATGADAPVAAKNAAAGLVVAADNHDATLWAELNALYAAKFAPAGGPAAAKSSIAGWSKQRELVVKGELEADVVSLGVGTDLAPLHAAKLLPDDWAYRLPHRSSPYGSVIVFLVPKGNPKKIKDWPDLAGEGVRVLTNSPKSSRTGRHAFLAAWGSVRQRGGTEADAKAFAEKVFKDAKLPAGGGEGGSPADPAVRPAPTFVPKEPGEVLLTWDKEARDAAKALDGQYEVVYPPITIRGEAQVAVLDAVANKHESRAAAEAYAKFLFSDAAQEVFVAHGYRVVRPGLFRKAYPDVPATETFDARDLFPDVAAGHERFFGENGLFWTLRGSAK